MSDPKPKPPTNYRALRATTERNLIIGFIVIVFVVGLGLIAAFYGGGAFIGGLGCLLLGAGMAGIVALALIGMGKLE